MTVGMPMVVLFTDFGVGSPYVGQMKAVLYHELGGAYPLLELVSDAPRCDPRASAYLLAAYQEEFPVGTVWLCVVDPGVGGTRRGALVEADGRWLVGPDNGLLEVVAHRARSVQWWDILWEPEHLSATFHGRDLFAPVAAQIARGNPVPAQEAALHERLRMGWPEELAEVIYRDSFGNAMTGLRAAGMPAGAHLQVGGRILEQARTFSDVAAGTAFWYENANGLVELAVNQGSAAAELGLTVGTPVRVFTPGR